MPGFSLIAAKMSGLRSADRIGWQAPSQVSTIQGQEHLGFNEFGTAKVDVDPVPLIRGMMPYCDDRIRARLDKADPYIMTIETVDLYPVALSKPEIVSTNTIFKIRLGMEYEDAVTTAAKKPATGARHLNAPP